MDKLFTLTAFGFYAIAIVGMVVHAVKKWAKGEIPGSVTDWFIKNPKATVGALIAAIGAVCAALLSGQISSLNDGAHILAVVGFGYAADSSMNSQEVK